MNGNTLRIDETGAERAFGMSSVIVLFSNE